MPMPGPKGPEKFACTAPPRMQPHVTRWLRNRPRNPGPKPPPFPFPFPSSLPAPARTQTLLVRGARHPGGRRSCVVVGCGGEVSVVGQGGWVTLALHRVSHHQPTNRAPPHALFPRFFLTVRAAGDGAPRVPSSPPPRRAAPPPPPPAPGGSPSGSGTQRRSDPEGTPRPSARGR